MCVKMDAVHLTTLQSMVNVITHRTSTDVYLGGFTFKHALDNNRVIAGKCGAIEAVVNTMKAHPGNAGACHYGCCALGNITADNGKCNCSQN